MIRLLREFARLFAASWPKGAILWTVEQLVFLALSIALQVAAQLLRGPIKREGPRLDDLSATGVQPGAIIPATHGHTTAPGTVIAQTRLKETKKKTKSGGKGGPTVSTTQYSYSIPAVAVAFSRRQTAAIMRIKANEKVIYERTEEEGLVYRNFTEIEVFPGSEGQAPSGILEAQEGVGNVPAYRGTSYFVLSDLQLADFGNRMPAFKVEVAEDLTAAETRTIGPAETNTPVYEYTIWDWDQQKAFSPDMSAGIDPSATWYEYSTSTLAQTDTHDLSGGTAGTYSFWDADPVTGYLVGSHMDVSPDSWWSYVYDPADKSFVTEADQGSDGQSVYHSTTGQEALRVITNGESAVVSLKANVGVNAHSFPDLVFLGSFARPAGTFGRGMVRGADGEAWVFWGDAAALRFHRYSVDSGGTVSETVVGSIASTDLHISKEFHAAFSFNSLFYDGADDALIVAIRMQDTGGANPIDYLIKWRASTGLVWQTELPSTLPDAPSRYSVNITGVYVLFQNAGGSTTYLVELADGTITEKSLDGDASGLYAESGVWNGTTGCFYAFNESLPTHQIHRYCLTFTPAKTSIGAILRAALTEWAPDVSPLTEGDHFNIAAALFADPYLVTGATFTQLSSPREIAEMCVSWKPVVFFEGGDAIEFRERDGTAAATIRYQDMGQRDRGSEVLPTVTVSRADDVQLPRETRVKFLDENRAFSANAAYARITRSRSSLVQELDLPFAGTPAEAKFAAWTAQGEAYAQRREITGTLPLQYFILEPGDVIDLPDNDGNLIEARVARTDLGANFIIELKASDHVNSYDNIAFAAEIGVVDALPLVQPQAAITYVLDLPRLTDDVAVDDGLQLLLGLGGSYESWKGGVIYRDTLSGAGPEAFGESYAEAETNFEEVIETRVSVDGGAIVTAPSADVDEFTIDRISIMRVAFDTFEPAFSTLTDAQFATTVENTFAIGNNVDGWEIVQAQEVAQIDAQTWDFSVLRRGMRGTEWAIGQAEAGDAVVRLETATLSRDAFSEAQIGETITYRGVTFNMDVASAADTDIAVVGRGLIPFAPSLGQVYRDGDGTVTGTLYARPLQADDDDLFLVTDPDFEIDVKDGPGGTVLRTITLTDTGAFTYTDAQQTTDFGSVQAAVDAELFHLDADGDRGYGREVIL